MTQVPVQPTTPPGWYADPSNPGLTRYWNGSAWTEQTAPVAPPPGPPPYGAGVVQPAYQPAHYPVNMTTNGLAIASLVLSLLGLFFIGSILGIIFGFVA